MSKKHQIKINAEYACHFAFGCKDWELRKNDRDYKKGDIIEFIVNDLPVKYYAKITYIFEGGIYGLEKGYVIMSIKKIDYSEFNYLSNLF